MDTILQSEAAECGLASVAMIASHYGYKSDLPSLRKSFPQTLKGLNLQQLMSIANELKLGSRALKLEMEHLTKLQLPCILHWDMNHFVVLKKIHRQKVIILDPAIGKRHLTLKEFAQHFTGIALELTPCENFIAEDHRESKSLFSLMKGTTGIARFLIQLLFLSLVLQLFALATPYYMQLIIDDVLLHQDNNLLVLLAFAFFFIALFNSLVTLLRQYIVIHIGAQLNQQLAFRLFRHLLHLPLDYFHKRHVGDIVSRFSSLQYLKQLITTNMVEALIDGLMAVTTLILIYLYSAKLATIVTLVLVLYLLVRLFWYRPLYFHSEEAIVNRAKEQSYFMESIRGIQAVKLATIEAKRQALWQNKYTDALNQEVKIERLKAGYQVANNLLFGFENVLVIYLAAELILTQSDFSIGMLTAFIAYKSQLTQRFSSLVEKLIEYKLAKLHFQRLTDITQTEAENINSSGLKPELKGSLQLTELNFKYANSDPYILQDLSLNVIAGSSVAIVGLSGCGKSTLLKLMLSLLPANSGKIKLDNVDITQLHLTHYRSQIASVMQDDDLLTGTIAENICQFDPQMDFDRVINVAKQASIHDDVNSMPMNYHSLIGDMGTALSGGQKQRILLARALYKKPKILFLDEATSHLDVETEQVVNHNLKKLKVTRIMIAHRPQTIAMADHVYRLENGRLHQVK